MYLYSKKIYCPNQVIKSGYLKIENGKIVDILDEIHDESFEDYSDYLIIPGFIDQHIHGWGTGAFGHNNSVESIMKMKKDLPQTGVTSFLATSGAQDIDYIVEGIKNCSMVLKNQYKDGASLLGTHLEGPFVNEEHAGMMNKAAFKKPSLEIMKKFVDAQDYPNTIKLMTMAIELDGAKDVIKYCKDNNIQISIGHSGATFKEIADLKEFGIGGVTHMFSGMKGFHHRELGVAGSALYFDDLYCEFAKQTGWTVLKEAFDIAYRIKGANRIIMTTDNTALSQITSERYHYIRKQTFIPDGDYLIVRNDDGSEFRLNRNNYDEIKDLELSYIKSIQNLIANVNPSVFDIIKMTSENSAKYLGVFDRKGSIEIGKDADLLVVDKRFNLISTYCMGEKYV